MPDPQVNERLKDVPARGLRAMFAGIGSLLGVSDKIRNKPAATATVPEPTGNVTVMEPEPVAAAPAAEAPETAVAETAVPETVVPETAVPETAVPETVVPETVVPETVAPEDAAIPEDSAAPETVVAETSAPEELPVANYDSLSIASLRARLRNLSPEQLTQLIEYEKSHAGRADVITMFERRIAKLAAEA